MRTHFTSGEVARILDVSTARLRSCLRAALYPTEFTAPRSFSFQDLLLLKTTKGLLNAHVPVARIRRILDSLKRQLPDDQHLWNVTIYANGRRVVVWDGRAHWHPDSGQFLFDFEPRALARQLTLKQPSAPVRRPLTSEQWFDLGSELENDSPEEARHAYTQALELDPTCVAAHINLGRLHQELRQFEPAERCYRTALRYNPDEMLAHFNLGVLLEEMNRPREAAESYRQALMRDNEFSDAHYNLALLYEADGHKPEAIRHFRAAQKLR
jgi:tetratricopeptide (TPR) repeat protein